MKTFLFYTSSFSTLILLLLLSNCKSSSYSWDVPPSRWGTPPGTITAIGDAGSPNEFTFKKWRFTQAELPGGAVEQIKIALEISTASLTCEWKDLEKSIRKKTDYFYISKFPQATVTIDGAKATGNGKYTCDALLTLKGISKTLPLTFSISDTAPYRVQGEGVILRSLFNFTGGGPKEEVPVRFDVVLP